MDYRNLQEKYGNKVTRAISDNKFISWLIKVLQLEGFGTAKTTTLIDGTNIDVVKTAEDETNVTYQINYFTANSPQVTYTIDEGAIFEWGQQLAADALNVDITIKRRSYALESVVFTNLDYPDQDRTAIDAAGVNAGVGISDYDWVLPNVDNDILLSNGDVTVGTVVATDEKGNVATTPVLITRQNRYIWGVCQGIEDPADIATQLASETGDIVPGDDDAFFRELSSSVGDFPSSIDIDTNGVARTFFVASIPTLEFKLESGIPFPIEGVTSSINLTNISGGVVSLARDYNVYAVELNTNFTLLKA